MHNAGNGLYLGYYNESGEWTLLENLSSRFYDLSSGKKYRKWGLGGNDNGSPTTETGNNESHSHQMCLAVNGGNCTAAADMTTSGADSSSASVSIDNNPPYTAVYMFERTA